MKKINFRRNKAILRVGKGDQPRPKRKWNWDRTLYFIILGVGLFFLGRYIFNHTLYVEARGHVLFDNVQIRNIDDCKIEKYIVQEGDSVEVGDTLFIYRQDDDNFGGSGNSVSISGFGSKSPEWIEKEIYQLEKEQQDNQLKIEQGELRRKRLKQRIESMQQEVMLDLVSQSNLEKMKEDHFETGLEIEEAKRRNQLLQQYLQKIKNIQENYYRDTTNQFNVSSHVSGGNGSGDESGVVKAYTSPISGVVTRIHIHEHEVALKSENILSIHKQGNIFIKAFFEQSDLSHLQEGDQVDITFPDGTESTGVIKRFYFTTYRLPEEFQKKYEPTTRSLPADIYPLNEKELHKWKAYYKMSVTIEKFKF